MPEIGLFDAIYSARDLRQAQTRSVPEEIITRILDAAIRGPSAGNARTGRSSWCAMANNGRLGMIYRKASDIASEMYKACGRPAHMTEGQYQRMLTSGAYLWATG